MDLLLDTHVFLWYISGDARLSSARAAAIRDPSNAIFLSSVALWEVVVKQELGKLQLPASAIDYIPRQRRRHGIESLPLDEASVMLLPSLPRIHRDPFDRMMVCQALAHGLVLVSNDEALRSYPVPSLE